ncbi:hypothetical protein [Planobispora takensis]|uniref:hypothetical protein n=1 Tax=Planobispora takensis TaxID=1367882 RepID=UPI0027DC04A8|nr:hypothetical protein [Planobispora takensis]
MQATTFLFHKYRLDLDDPDEDDTYSKSLLTAQPYDLRHAAVSLWLNAGVAAPNVADRADHGVDVLLKVYAKCLDGGEEIANRRIDNALAA